MSEDGMQHQQQTDEESTGATNKHAGDLTRRGFLRLAGVAGATVGVGAGLGGILAACGGEETTTSSAGAGTTASPASAAAGASTSTSVAAQAEEGREIVMGIVSPVTGSLASFAIPMDYCVSRWQEASAGGLVLADNKKHAFKFLLQDSQSDSNRAAQVAGDLILNSKIDMMLVGGAPDTVNPAADQCETNGVPCLAVFCPWEPFYFGRGATAEQPFNWTYLACTGAQDIMVTFADMWEQLPTNKKVGLLLANDADGNAWADEKTGLPPILKEKGFTYVMPSQYQPMSEDFSAQIAQFKKEGCEICSGTMSPPDFTNFWKQAVQQSYHPVYLTIGKALLFPQTVEAIGSIVYNATVELAWHPHWPFTSSLTGETCQQIADDFEAKTNQQWTAPLGQYMLFEWAVDVLKRATSLDDKAAVAEAIKTTKMNTLGGPIDFTAPVDMASKHPVPNVYKPVTAGGQWIKGTKHPFDIVQVSNATDPNIPVQARIQPMQYS